MAQFFAACTDGLGFFHFRPIANGANLQEHLAAKTERPTWYLGINNKGYIDVNPAAPLFIYGAFQVSYIFSDTGEVMYDAYRGAPAHRSFVEAYTSAFRHYMENWPLQHASFKL